MGIDHGRLNILVSEETLNFPDVDTVLEQVCRKAVAECMHRRMFGDTGLFYGVSHCHLNRFFADMVTTDLSTSRVHRQLG